jgi:hypothetical protein
MGKERPNSSQRVGSSKAMRRLRRLQRLPGMPVNIQLRDRQANCSVRKRCGVPDATAPWKAMPKQGRGKKSIRSNSTRAIAGPKPLNRALVPSCATVFLAQSKKPEYVRCGADCMRDFITCGGLGSENNYRSNTNIRG